MATEEITKRGVLIADSTPHMANLVGQMLRSLGRRDIREAYDAQRAMSELRRRAFEILIIDADLAGLDGIAFTRKLRAATDCRNRLVPIIMMSSAPDAKRIAEARDAGVTEFLRKPFAASHLQSRLAGIEANPRSFVETEAYKGPDRRRKVMGAVARDRRGKPALPKAG